MNFNITSSTTAEIPRLAQDSQLYEYDNEYSEYFYPGKVQTEKFHFNIEIFYLTLEKTIHKIGITIKVKS